MDQYPAPSSSGGSGAATSVALRTLATAVLQAGATVPCVTDPARFVAPSSVAEVAEAVAACSWCPALAPCRDAAEVTRPQAVVQAGFWWTLDGPTARARGRWRGG